MLRDQNLYAVLSRDIWDCCIIKHVNNVSNSAVMIFAKLPEVGYVKTRLITEYLFPEDTKKLYSAFLRDTIEQAISSAVSHVVFSVANAQNHQVKQLDRLSILSEYQDAEKIMSELHSQPSGTFGVRMFSAIQWAFERGIEKLIILGADAPHIQPSLINAVLEQLNDYDAVIGPSRAGGIYLIGLTDVFRGLLAGFEDVFEGVELTNLAKFINSLGLSFSLCEELTDIDTEEDLVTLISWLDSMQIAKNNSSVEIFLPTHTIQAIKDLCIKIEVDGGNNREKYLIRE